VGKREKREQNENKRQAEVEYLDDAAIDVRQPAELCAPVKDPPKKEVEYRKTDAVAG
jgi:hypothetical protein